VRGVGQECAEGDDELPAELLDGTHQLGAELAPAHRRLDAADQDNVAAQVGRRGDGDPRRGPRDAAAPVLTGGDPRPVDLEVVEVLGVELAEEDEDIADYVRSLEETRDTADLPEASGEAIAREFEKYLKRRGEES